MNKQFLTLRLLLVLVLLFGFSPVDTGHATAASSHPEVAGRGYYGGIGGYNKTIDIVEVASPAGTYAYIGEGSGLVILNVSTLADIERLSRINLLEVLEDIQVVGDIVYVADGWGGLFVVDASDLTSPEILRNWSNGSPFYEVQVSDDGSILYVAGGDSGLIILDVDDPANPSVLGQYDTPGNLVGLHVIGETAYLADEGGGFHIVNVNDLENITCLGDLYTPGQVLGVRIEGERAYLGDGANGLVIADISDLANPQILTTVDTAGDPASLYPGEASRLQVVGDYVYLADFMRGLQRIDINPASPDYGKVVGNMPNATREVEVGITTVYAASGNEVFFNNLSLGDPIGRYATGQGYSVTKDGNLVTLSAGWGGLFLIDAANPQKMTYHALFEDLPGPANDVAVDGIRAFVGTGETTTLTPDLGVTTVDISDPDIPVRLVGERYVTYPEPVRGLKAAGGYIYAAASGSGLLIIRYPDIPYTLAGSYNTPGTAYDVFLSEDRNTAYVADGSGGLQIIDVTDRTQPVFLGSLALSDARAVLVVENTAYVASDMAGFYTIDVSDPTNPVELSHLLFDTPVYNVSITEHLVFLACGPNGIRVVNVNDPVRPVVVANWATPSQSYDALNDEGVIYVADGEAGLQALKPTSANGEIDAGGGVIQTDDRGVRVSFPSDAVSEPVQVTYNGLYAPNQALPSGVSTPVISFNLQAQNGSGQAVTEFAAPLTITITYLQSLLDERGLDESDLKLVYWSSVQEEWSQVFPCDGCTQDIQADTITILLDHFSEFTLVVDPPDEMYLPLVWKTLAP